MEIYNTNVKYEKKQKAFLVVNMWSKEMENMNYSLAFGIFLGFPFDTLVL